MFGWLKNTVSGWFIKPDDKKVIDFFGPLVEQVKQAALKVGKDNLDVGLDILKGAAMGAALAASTSPTGEKTKAAEKAFLDIVKGRGLDAIHNAEAGLIKAAVAIVQDQITSIGAPVAPRLIQSGNNGVLNTVTVNAPHTTTSSNNTKI